MVLALLILVLVCAAVHWWEYTTSVQEYTFSQPATIGRHDELRSVLSEKTPTAVEIGALPWRPEVAEQTLWTAQTGGLHGVFMDILVTAWLAEEKPRPALVNQESLADQIDLRAGLCDIDAGRAWWWLPGLHNVGVDILPAGGVVGLSWVSAERQWIGCTHGGPLTLWLVNSRYRRYLPAEREEPIDPWSLTVTLAPWIGRVQYIEVTVKPGWCMGIPANWGFAIRSDDEAWWWTASQHSVVSWILSGKLQEHTESLSSESEE